MKTGLRSQLQRLVSRRTGRTTLDKQHDQADTGSGPLHYRPAEFTDRAPHVRDAFNFSRWMWLLTAALVPALFVGLYNTGYQVGEALRSLGTDATLLGHGSLLASIGLSAESPGVLGSAVVGLVYFVPVYLVALLIGGGWEHLFAVMRGRNRVEGVALTTLLFALSLPPTVPLWQVAVGMSFGVVLGKEVFGGTGKTFLNPALVGLVFLYFAYPDTMRNSSVWVPVAGWADGALLDRMASGGIEALEASGITWLDSFFGWTPGAFGDRSAAACVVGAVLLVSMRVVSWRILAGGVLGLAVAAVAFGSFASGLVPLADLAWYWHVTLGSFAFGLVFFATDPVTAPLTDAGRWIYGMLIGAMTVIIRAANATHSDGVMLAILLGNVSAPLIDHFVVRANVRRRARRHG